MGDIESLLQEASRIADTLLQQITDRRKLVVVSHHDADGISAAGIMTAALIRKGAKFTTRILPDLDQRRLQELKGSYDFHIFCDLGGGWVKGIREVLGDKWFVLDHHETSKEELSDGNVLNAWRFGFDGGVDVSSSGMAYLVAREMDRSNLDLSVYAVVGALGDRQDRGSDRGLDELNKEIAGDAQRNGLLEVTQDLVLYGRETRPIHESIASTVMPYIPMLTGNIDTCLSVLTSAGINLKEDGRWRTMADLDKDEKAKLIDAIIPYLAPTGRGEEALKELIGTIYILLQEDDHCPLRDGREFATVLNACGRMKRGGIGVSLCLGDRNKALEGAEETLMEYRKLLNKYLQGMLGEEERKRAEGTVIMFVGDGLLEADLTGAVASMICNIPVYMDKIVLVRTVTDVESKYSARRGPNCKLDLNLGLCLGGAARKVNGSGGGHYPAAGAKIPRERADEFFRLVADDARKM